MSRLPGKDHAAGTCIAHAASVPSFAEMHLLGAESVQAARLLSSSGRHEADDPKATTRAACVAALVYSEGLYVSSSSSLGLLDVGERQSAAQHPLLPQSTLRTGLISRLYGAFST